jgi:hypothetical protein
MKLDLLCVICMRVFLSLSSVRLLCEFGLAANGETRVMRTALFWAITQRVVAISYRIFGTTYRSHRQVSRIQILLDPFGFLKPEDGTDRLFRNVGKILPLLAA